jgi:hypothetical protein
MSERKRVFLETLFILGFITIPYLDAIYITPGIKESGIRMEIQCHDDPKNCWIQNKDKRHA